MAVSQSDNTLKKQSVECDEQVASVTFDPKQGQFKGFASGSFATSCLAVVAIALIAACKWDNNSFFLKSLFVACLLCIVIMAIVNVFIKKPKISVAKKTISFDGIGEKSLYSLLGLWVNRIGLPHLPEPDAKVDPVSGKVLPFQEGEKEKLLKEQREIVEAVEKEIIALKEKSVPAITSEQDQSKKTG